MVERHGDMCRIVLPEQRQQSPDEAADRVCGLAAWCREGRHRKVGSEELVGAVDQVQLHFRFLDGVEGMAGAPLSTVAAAVRRVTGSAARPLEWIGQVWIGGGPGQPTHPDLQSGLGRAFSFHP